MIWKLNINTEGHWAIYFALSTPNGQTIIQQEQGWRMRSFPGTQYCQEDTQCLRYMYYGYEITYLVSTECERWPLNVQRCTGTATTTTTATALDFLQMDLRLLHATD